MKKNITLPAIILLTALMLTGCNSASQVHPPSGASAGFEKRDYIAHGDNTGKYWPTAGWKSCDPEKAGMSSEKLALAMEYAATPGFYTQGIMVIKNGYIVSEAYFKDFEKSTLHVSNSMAKSFSSALIGMAIDKGFISGVDEKLCTYYENWDCDNTGDLRRNITLRHALTLTTGLEWHEDWSKWDFKTNDALKMAFNEYFVDYVAQRPGRHEPGQHFLYSTGDPMLLSKIIQDTTGMTAFDFARQHLFDPLNIEDIRWDKDEAGYTATAWGLYTTLRNFAKFGFLFLNNGKWEDQQIVSEQWVTQSTRTDPGVRMWDAYGYLWHVNLPLRLSKSKTPTHAIPADGYMAEGVQGQNIIIIPSKNLLIVKVANEQKDRIDLAKLITMVLEAEKK